MLHAVYRILFARADCINCATLDHILYPTRVWAVLVFLFKQSHLDHPTSSESSQTTRPAITAIPSTVSSISA
jgi:hypothetical protein